MAIKRIKVSNFKSFKDLELELGKFNVIVGANASGKTNFTDIFKFVKDIGISGLGNAISSQGYEYLTNIGIGSPRPLLVSATCDLNFGFRMDESTIAMVNTGSYEFVLNFKSSGTDFQIEKDQLILKVDYVKKAVDKKDKPSKDKAIGAGEINFWREDGQLRTKIEKPENLTLDTKNVLPFFLTENIPPKTLLLEGPLFSIPPLAEAFSSFGIYYFDPKKCKGAPTFAGKADLEEDGNNLSLVLKNILEDTDKKRLFSNLLKDLLPFVDDVKIEKFADKSLQFQLKETYFPQHYFPASFISDGTASIAAVISTLYFEKKSLFIIEEPERNIHPHLISRVLNMMKEASNERQIIITTHSPEVVKHSGIENILFVSRDKDGFSIVSKPGEKEGVKIFLQNELGLDDLFVQNLLEV